MKLDNNLHSQSDPWGDEPPLQALQLYNCSLTATASLELVQSLSSCRHLTALNLEENKLSEAGHQLAQSIRSWVDEPPLQALELYNCSLTATASLELVQSLSSCRHLTVLDLRGNKLGEAGHQLAQSIRSWGDLTVQVVVQLHPIYFPLNPIQRDVCMMTEIVQAQVMQ